MRNWLTTLSILIPVIITSILLNARLRGSIAPDAQELGYLIALAVGWICLVISRWRTSSFKWALYLLYPFWMAPGMLIISFSMMGLRRIL